MKEQEIRKERRKKETEKVDENPAIGETASAEVGVEITAVRKVWLARAKVPRKLLVPESMDESPMMNSAGANGEGDAANGDEMEMEETLNLKDEFEAGHRQRRKGWWRRR